MFVVEHNVSMPQHHAFLFLAHSLGEASLPELYKTPSVDVEHLVIERFSIDDARALSASAARRPFESPSRVFVIVSSELAIEAQNALLKLFEEPPCDVVFYIVLKPTSFILPTLRSRLYESTQQTNSEQENEDFPKFLSASLSSRLTDIAQKTKVKDTIWTESILRGCEQYVQKDLKANHELLDSLIMVRSYSARKGASVKMLLEALALLLPVS